jgi:glycosyltransferase involved in cell wall biosynthesis
MSARPLISAAMIVKDEERCLGRCLESIAGWCDEVIVVDTGSTDATVAIATSSGAHVHHLPWAGDFAQARNHALDRCTGEWILYVDADEVLAPVDRATAHAELQGATDALILAVWFQARPNHTPYREYRIWRNRPDIRFVGRIHETPIHDLRRILAAEQRTIRDTDVFRFQHDGYEGDQLAKHHRNLPLLEARVEELPDRVYLWNHLGEVREALGDRAGAIAAWQAGVDVVRRLGIDHRSDVLAYAGLGLARIQEGDDITELCDELERLAPAYRTTTWMRAQNHRRQGRYAEAIPCYEALLGQPPTEPDLNLSYDVAMFGDWALDGLAECHVKLGQADRAAAAYADAAKRHPDRLDYRTKSAGLLALARQQEAGTGEV